MAKRVAGRRRRGKPSAVSGTRRRAQQRALQAARDAAITQRVQQVLEHALAEEVTALLGRPKYARRTQAAPRRAGTPCSQCGQDWAPRFARAGSDPRTLLTLTAAVTLRVPRVSGGCGGTVPLEFATFGRYPRRGGEVEERARQLAGLCLALHDIPEVLAGESGQWVARSTLNSGVHDAAGLAASRRGAPLGRVPAVVLLDGLWVKLMVPTGERYRDRQGRDRARMRREKVPLLVAYGRDPATGARGILDWTVAPAEDTASWQGLLERLYARGLHAAGGLTLFVHDGGGGLEAALQQGDFGPGVLQQRCSFPVRRTVRKDVRGEPGMSREQRQARRRAVLQDAAASWQPTDRAAVRRRYEAFGQRGRGQEPGAVAALERAFESTLAYLEARARGREWGEDWPVQDRRTTSALERVNRVLRQKARQVGTFQAERGLTAAVVRVLVHRGLTVPEPPADLWTEVLEAGLLAA